MKLPVRLRAWHALIVEDADGGRVCEAATSGYAQQIIETLNAASSTPRPEHDVEVLIDKKLWETPAKIRRGKP